MDIYKIGTEALLPPIPVVWKTPVNESKLDFLRNDITKKLFLIYKCSHPGIRRKPTFMSRWNQLDEVLDKGNTAPIKSSYDAFMERRFSNEQRYLENNEALSSRLKESNQKLVVINSEKVDKSFADAIQAVGQGNFKS